MFSKLFKSQGGFTLVEVLVTIGIISVLFGIVTLTLSGVTSAAKTDMCDNEELVLESAAAIWIAANPAATLTPNSGSPVTVTSSTADIGAYIGQDSYATWTWNSAGDFSLGVCP
jgi:prepilin-type N-terminal cleavage/methylation domain-containing protein